MARQLRIDIENGLYHVTSLGCERRRFVRDDWDRRRWVGQLARVALRCGWRLFAWALVSNHLYLRTPQSNLSAGSHELNSCYASGFNGQDHRSGSLFQGRFKVVLAKDESPALAAEAVGATARYSASGSTPAISKTVQRVEARREADPNWKGQLAELAAELANPRFPVGSRPTKLQVKT